MPTLREILRSRDNDYTALETAYRRLAGCELVTDPFGSYAAGPAALTRTASVLIGSYNSAKSLEKALRSLEACTFNRRHPDLLEAIVVDDGSTDGTREVVLGLRLDLNVCYVRQDRGGLARAHNTGAAFSEAEVLVFSDSDMVHTPYAIEELMKRHQVLDGVTLLGFRFGLEAGDARLSSSRLLPTLSALVPEFWRDFRLAFPGRPTSICRETRHLKDLGFGRSLLMANGTGYDLAAMVVGAFFSLERTTYQEMGGSDERLAGWGCEDSLIGGRSVGLGNKVVPVYSAASGHLSHPERDPAQSEQFQRNIQTAHAILDQPFPDGAGGDLSRFRARAREVMRVPRSGRPPELPSPGLPRADSHRTWADMLYALGRFGEAAERYRLATEDDQTDCWSCLGRAKSLRELGEIVTSLEAFDRCLTIDPANQWAWFERGLTLARDGRHGDARAAVERARSVFDARWALDTASYEHKRRGNHHAGQGLHGIATTDFDLALIADPESPWAHFDRALSLRTLGRLPEALASAAEADRFLHPGDGNRSWVHLELGELHLDLGDLTGAKLELERANRLAPGNTRAAYALAMLADRAETASGLLCVLPLIDRLATIPGWLSPGEIDLLVSAVLRSAAATRGRRRAVVELGSYCGKSTVAIASGVRAAGDPKLTFHAIDPHRDYEHGGKLDSFGPLMANLRHHGLEPLVDVIQATSDQVAWDQPIALLFIDALHDYESVHRDYYRFAPYILPRGIVAFHDYLDYCPGVQRLVDELLSDGGWRIAAHRDSLIVLGRAVTYQ
jgi:GT2 family glycosyltransferase